MNILFKKLLLLFCLCCSFHYTLKAQIDIEKISGIETEKFEGIIDSLHHTYEYFNYPSLVKRLIFVATVAEENQNDELWIISKYYTADIFYKANHYQEAKEILNEILDENLSKEAIASVTPFQHYLYANILLELDEVDQAEAVINTRLTQEKDETSIHSYLKNLVKAKLAIKKANYAEADILLSELEKVVSNFPESYLLNEVYYLKAKIFKETNDLDQAEDYAINAYNHAKNNSYTLYKLKSAEILAEIYQLKGNLQNQINYLSEANEIKNEIISFQSAEFTQEKITDSNSIQSAVDTISELSLTNSEQQKSLKFNQLTIILSALFIGILSLFTVSLYKNNNLRARANQLLQQKNTDLIESREKALAATKYREQFLSTITHELRTPIYAVTGLTYLLLKENPTPQQKEHLKSLKHSGEHLLSLINNILDINKLESNKISKVEFDFYLKSQLKNTLKTLEKSAKDSGVALHLEVDDKIPKLLNGDMVKISQVIINLVANAIKFSQGGDVWVRAKHHKETDEKVGINFEVEDNGVGIEKSKHKQIFEKFNQGSDKINSNFGGTGLGLPIVKNLLTFLNSEINLESEPGKGAKFYFSITFNKALQDDLIPAETSTNPESDDLEEPTEVKTQQEVFDDKRILVVEDNKLNQKITCKILEKKNLSCEIANNGKEAVDLVAKHEYDVILMDIHMPVMDGIEATKEIRKTENETPIIALTAVSISEELKDFFKYGFDDIIPKPYKTELFYEKIYKALLRNEDAKPNI